MVLDFAWKLQVSMDTVHLTVQGYSSVSEMILSGIFEPYCKSQSRAGNLLIRSLAHFAQIKRATVSNSLRSLKTNERP